MKDKKQCSKCREVKAVELFPKTRAQCKACKAEYNKAHRQANKEKMAECDKAYYQANKEKYKAYRQANKEKMAEYDKAYYQANKEKYKAYRQANKEKIAEKKKAYRKANKEKARAYRKANKEKIAERGKAYCQANPEKFAARSAKRRAAKLQATPIWYPEEKAEIERLYELRNELRIMGLEAHVDHIIPLQNDLVCGLHTLANLQLLTAEENLSKRNRFTPG